MISSSGKRMILFSRNMDIKHLSKLAHIKLSEEEEQKLTPQLEEILKYVSQLRKVATENIEPTSQVTGLVNIFREDKIDTTRVLSQKDALRNAPATHNGFVKVKSVL